MTTERPISSESGNQRKYMNDAVIGKIIAIMNPTEPYDEAPTMVDE